MTATPIQHLIECYLGLESFEVTEELLNVCGATIDVKALSVLKRRLSEEEAQVPKLEALGYIRLREKSEQLIASLKPLIAELEDETHDQPEKNMEAKY